MLCLLQDALCALGEIAVLYLRNEPLAVAGVQLRFWSRLKTVCIFWYCFIFSLF